MFAPSALVVSVRMRRRVMGFLTAFGMAAVVALGTAVPASAGPGDFTVDNIKYTVNSADPTTVAVTGYEMAGGTTVDIPGSVVAGAAYTVTSIGDYAFESNLLTSVTIPNSVTSIGNFAFYINRLESVTVPDSVTSIGFGAFRENKLTSVTIGDSVTSIGNYAFHNNLLTSVTIGDSVTSFGNGAFSSNKLGSVTIPDSVTSIGSEAFRNNWLTSVTIPASVTSIGDVAFGDNASLTSVTFVGPAPTTVGTSALGVPAAVQVYYYEKYGLAAGATDGFTAPTWKLYPASVLAPTAFVVSLDIDVTVGDTVAGATVEVSAEGLLVGSAYAVVVRSTPTTIASGHATSTGTVSDSTGRMPSGLAAGPHTVTFTGTDADGRAVSRVAYLTVSDTGTVTYLSYSAAESILLAETGFEVAPFGAAALLLLVAGVVLMLRRRRVAA